MTSLYQHLLWAQQELVSSALNFTSEEALKKARTYLSFVLKKDPSYTYAFSEYTLTSEETTLFCTLITQASQGIPFSRIIQEREFWSLPFKLNAATLDPRPESELIIEQNSPTSRSKKK